MLKIIRWAARITGGLFILFVLWYISLYIFGGGEQHEHPLGTNDYLAITFGIVVLIGLFLGYFREAKGGYLILVGVVGLHWGGSWVFSLIDIPLIPGILYLIYSWFNHGDIES